MNPFRRKSQEHHDVCYDSKTKKYHNMISSRQISQNDDSTNLVLSPAAQIQDIPWSVYNNNEHMVGRFTKLQDSAITQRVKKMTGHRKNPSNGSDKIELGSKTSPPYKHSNSEGGLTPPTPKNFSGSISPGNNSILSTVLPFPSPTTPGSVHDGIKGRTHSYVELRARAPTESPVENNGYIPPPVFHSRSKSNDSHVEKQNQKEILSSLANIMNKSEKQTVVENHGYHKFDASERNRSQSNVSRVDQPDQHYTALKSSIPTIPAIPPRRKVDSHEPPPIPPKGHSLLDRVIELPKSFAPTLPTKSYNSDVSVPNYLLLDSRRNPSLSPVSPGSTISLSSPGNSSDYVTPSSTAPVLTPRPDTLNLSVSRTAGIRREHPYVQLATNLRVENGASDTHPSTIPPIPMNIRRH